MYGATPPIPYNALLNQENWYALKHHATKAYRWCGLKSPYLSYKCKKLKNGTII
jgi:hypothetical protein